MRLAKTLPKDQDIVIVRLIPVSSNYRIITVTFFQCLSGRGDKDVEQISELLPGKWADKLDWHISTSA